MTIKELNISLGFLVLCGCVTSAKVNHFKSQPLIIDTKVQIKDVRKDETQSAKIQIVLLTDQAIRMEVTALFGYPVASIVITPDKIQLALHTSKKFIDGPFSARTLYPVFKQNINPRILWNTIHNRNLASADFKCRNDENGRALNCAGPEAINIDWTYEDAFKRRIVISNPQFEMIWVFKDQSTLAATQNETFVLKKPEEYQLIQIK